MLSIHIPQNFEPERRYIIDVLFGEFLGLEYTIESRDAQEYELHIDEKILKIKDAFFGVYDDYLQKEAIPQTVEFLDGLPVIYGENKIGENYCGLDIFGSAFFMLSRFEEYVIKMRDVFGRFPSSEALAVRCGFEKKAVVEGYVELLWNLLVESGFKGERKKRTFRVVYTHDIDHLRFWKSFGFFAARVQKCLFKYRNLPQALREIRDYLSVKCGIKKDPYDTFDRLMDGSEKSGGKSIFYFLAGKNHELDADFDTNDLKPVIEKIKKRGHTVAIHPSFLSFDEGEILKNEIAFFDEKIEDSRQHYLRFEIPLTWQILDAAGIKRDSSLGFSDRVGFRCGCCTPFPVFDFINKRPLNLRESPLIMMDTALLRESHSPQEAKALLESLKAEVRKYNGEFVILWHNSSFGYRWGEYEELYETLYQN